MHGEPKYTTKQQEKAMTKTLEDKLREAGM
jgi:hypothetical protein